MTPERLPESGMNNRWFRYNDSDAVLVFVHGVLSDSRSTWLYTVPEDCSAHRYWPALIASDRRFKGIAIYLAGYHTATDIAAYEVGDCANEVFGALRREVGGCPPVMGKAKITFVCHSMGGIVVRRVLVEREAEFKEKQVGLVLIASPSIGSGIANWLDYWLWLYNHEQGRQLRWGNEELVDLDKKFKELVDQKRVPELSGVEFFENRFIFHRKWLPAPGKVLVVDKESAVRYFPDPKQIPGSDHYSISKPNGIDHLSHVFLFDFLRDNDLLPTHVPPGPGGESLEASVVAKVKVGGRAGLPEEGSGLDIELEITCKNKTSGPVVMNEKYVLPVRHASDCSAFAHNRGPLTTRFVNNRVEVEFTDSHTSQAPTIVQGGSYSWTLKFKTPGLFEAGKDRAILCGPYLVNPLHVYQGVSIASHDFQYTFSFMKPEPWWGWLFMENYVVQTNDRKVVSTCKRYWDRTDCEFADFTLAPPTDKGSGNLKIYFARIYRPRSKLFAVVTFFGGMVSGILASAFAYFAFRWLFR